MAIANFINENANVQIVCNLLDLKEVIQSVINETQQQQQQKQQEQYLIPEEVCRLLGVSKPTLWRYAKSGYLAPVKVGKFNRYRKSDITRILEGRL